MRAPTPILIAIAVAATAACSSQPTPRDARDASVAPAPKPDAAPPPAPIPEEPKLVLTRVDYAALEGWSDDDHRAALAALDHSCRTLLRRKPDWVVGKHPIAGTARDWRPACEEGRKLAKARGTTAAAAKAYFEKHFVPHAAANHSEREGRFTGYYNATVRASRKKGGKYTVPVWGRPRDLVSADLSKFIPKLRGERIWGRIEGKRLVPYPNRAAINRGAITAKAKVILWADDAIDVFFAQVQGSATVELAGGGTTRIGVAGKNGRIYTAIGRVLIADGELTRETVSMQSIRKWMLDHPDKAAGLMEKNEAFVFFRELEGDGPRGAQGVVLTPGRSLAVDRRWIPLSLPLWVETKVPRVGGKTDDDVVPYNRLMIAQDTGGAIRGPVRGDIYFGHDSAAFDQAGRMKGMGQYYVLLPRSVADAR